MSDKIERARGAVGPVMSVSDREAVYAALDEAEALRAGRDRLREELEYAVEALEEYYDSIKRHQSDRSREDFLLRLNHYRAALHHYRAALLAQEDKDDGK